MYGLVLEGGGTKGSYQMGVYDALVDRNIEIGAIVGTSIGAMNGAMFAQGDRDVCRELWKNIDYNMLVDENYMDIEKLITKDFSPEDIKDLANLVINIIKSGGIDTSTLKKTIDKYIDEDKLRSSKVDFGLVTYNLTNLKAMELFIKDIPRGHLNNAILASAYLPIFKTEKLNGDIYLDGAFYDNLPFNMLRNKGYEKLILVRIHGTGRIRKIDLPKDQYILISPREDLGSTFDCDPKRSNYNMKLGYYDSLKVLDNLDGDKFYIKNPHKEEFFMNVFKDLSSEKIKRIQNILKLNKKPSYRSIFEDILPKLADYLNLSRDYSYKDIYIGLMEVKADNLKAKRFKVYDYNELDSYLRCKRSSLLREETLRSGFIGNIREKVSKIPSLNKSEVLLEVSDIIISGKGA